MTDTSDRHLQRLAERLADSRCDEDAWSELYELLWPYVFTILYRAVGARRELAEDLSQDVFLRLLRYTDFEALTKAENLRAYVARVARNQLYNHLSGKRKSVLNEAPQPEYVGAVVKNADEGLELEELLEQLLLPLSESERDLALMLLSQMSLNQISEDLGVSYSAAAVRVHRLRNKLKNHPLFAELGRESETEGAKKEADPPQG